MQPKLIIDRRIASFRKKMAEKNVNLSIIAKPLDIFHFSNFNPIIQSMISFMVIPLEGEPCLLVQALRGTHAKQEGAIDNVKMYGKWSDNVSIAMDPFDALAEIIKEYKIGDLRAGSELGYLPHENYNKICSKLNVNALTDITSMVNEERLVKDEMAIECLRKAADLANVGMNVMVQTLRNGGSEAEGCTEATYEILKTWQKKYPEYELAGFGTTEEQITASVCVFCTSGTRISYGCDTPKQYVPKAGELVLPVTIVKLAGYSVENERSLYVKKLDDYKMSIFKTVIEARNKVFDTIQPGNTFEDLYLAASGVFEKNGFGKFLPGRIGHGMGLALHEFPSLAPNNKMKLAPGMVFTVEPGLMSAAFGGVRPSDTVLVTENGYENLTNTENGILKI